MVWTNAHQQDADCKPDSVVKNHLSGPGVAGGIQQLTQGLRPGKPQAPFVKPCSGWGLSQFLPSPVGTVSSCLTFSPLLRRRCRQRGGLFSVTLSCSPGSSGGKSLLGIILPCGVRTFLPFRSRKRRFFIRILLMHHHYTKRFDFLIEVTARQADFPRRTALQVQPPREPEHPPGRRLGRVFSHLLPDLRRGVLRSGPHLNFRVGSPIRWVQKSQLG